jgi:flavin-dependent dehydrogenase
VERCDVLVVGGGPAGSSLAWALRGSGLDVVIFDRKTFPRDKVCAGWITPQIPAALELDLGAYAEGRTLQPIRGFTVSRQGDRIGVGEHGDVVSFGIRRCEFDHHLLLRSGARLRLGAPLEDLRREAGRWLANGELAARWLVGAGGHFCPVARALGARPGEGEPTTVVAREVEFELSPAQRAACGARADLPELVFTRDLRGYGWVVRKGDWLNVGLGRQDPKGFPRHAEAFLEWLVAHGKVPAETPRSWRGHAYLLHEQSPRPLGGEAALLVGDAAGMAYARSGEGIRPAVEAGLLAARALRAGFAAGSRDDADTRRAYERAVIARLGPRYGRVRPGLTDRLPAPWRGPVAARCLASSWFARTVVVDRWFLHRSLPALAA